MIRFMSENVDTAKLQDVVRREFIDFVAGVIGPLFGDYESTGLDYSSCQSEEDKRRVFARNHLGEIDIEITSDGVILNDALYVEGTSRSADGWFDLEVFLNAVKQEFPNLEISGDGEIDYDTYVSEYEIVQDGDSVHVIYDGEE